MNGNDFMRTWQVDRVKDPSSGVTKEFSQLTIYPDPSGHKGGVIIRYTDFGSSYPTFQNGHYVDKGGRSHIAALMSMKFRIVLRLRGDKLVATTQHRVRPSGHHWKPAPAGKIWRAKPVV